MILRKWDEVAFRIIKFYSVTVGKKEIEKCENTLKELLPLCF